MAEALRNEVSIELAGETRTLRATFGALRGIEKDLGINIVPLISKVTGVDVGVNEFATVIYHGLRGYDDTRLSLDAVGNAVMEVGLTALLAPVGDFLFKAMEGVSAGKPKPGEPKAA
jgi:hypothetical protein